VMSALLLLDLDGVTVLRVTEPGRTQMTVILQPTLIDAVSNLGFRVVILTHRSRAEAEQIVRAIVVDAAKMPLILAAEDLVKAAVRDGQIFKLLRRGIQKAFAVPYLERACGVSRDRMAVLDDNEGNIRTMIAAGVGLKVLAPTALLNDQVVRTFRSDVLLELLNNWRHSTCVVSDTVELASDLQTNIAQLPRIDVVQAKFSGTIRKLAKTFRRVVSASHAVDDSPPGI
jgi:hypothetical protein